MANNHKKSGFSLVLLSQLVIVLLAAVLIHWLNVPFLDPRFNDFVAVCGGILLAILTHFLFVLLYRYGGKFAQQLLRDIRRVSGLFATYSWGHFLLIAMLAGVGEELLFRVFLQAWLHDVVGIVWAIALTSLVFGLLHYLSFAYFMCTLVMSTVFGVGYYFSGSALMVMVWHGVYDFIALAVLVKWPQVFVKIDVNE